MAELPSPIERFAWPLSVRDFEARYWTRDSYFGQGDPARFDDLLSWPQLNRLLEAHRREPSRLRLVRGGKEIDPRHYTSGDLGYGDFQTAPSLLTRELQSGATLIVERIDELHPPLYELARALEIYYRASVQVNLYAGWRNERGLNPHEDDHEVFIVQCAGRKEWLVDKEPFEDTFDQNAKEFRILEPGDVLYIPRGHHHVARPLDEPTFHLTVSVQLPRVSDVLSWIGEKLRRDPRSDENVSGDMNPMDLKAAISNVDIQQFLEEFDPTGARRSKFQFPWSATPTGLPPTDDFRARLAVSARFRFESSASSNVITVKCGRKSWLLPNKARFLLSALDPLRMISFSDICRDVSPDISPSSARTLLAMLAREGLIELDA